MAGTVCRQTDGRDRVSWLGRQLEWAGREKGAAAGEQSQAERWGRNLSTMK